MPKVVDAEMRRHELAEATARLIARGGLEAVTMRDVATEAGLTTGSVTHYFSGKRELLLFTLNSSLARRRERRRSAAQAGPVQALRTSLEGALPLDAERRRHWMVTIAFCTVAAGDAELAAAQRDAYREFRDTVAEQLVACGLTARHASREAERLIAVVDGVAVQALFDAESWPPARQSAMLADAIASVPVGNDSSRRSNGKRKGSV
jgi:AcrR family transcriptional regulator